MIDPELITKKALTSLSLLTEMSEGYLQIKIEVEEDLDSLIILALESFYDNYSSYSKKEGKSPSDIELLEICLIEAEKVLAKSGSDQERVVAIKEVMDLRRTIRRLKSERKENDSE